MFKRNSSRSGQCLTLVGGAVVLTTVLVGCSSAHYRRSADKEVYDILRQVDRQIIGGTNHFDISTRFSGRDPRSIPPEEIIGDRTATNRRVINLEQALDLAVKNSREYQTQKEQLYLTALSLTGARYEFGPQFFASSTAQVDGSPGGAQIGSVRSRVGVSQLLKTGGRLTVELGNSLIRYFTGRPVGQARNSAINALSVDLTQPLLRGFGINDPAVENLTQAERNVVYAVRSFSLFQEEFAVEVVSEYFDLLTQKDIVRNNYRNYLSRVETTKYLDARRDRERRTDVDDARTAELGAKISYINSVANYLTQLDAFKLRLGLPITEQIYLEDTDLRELTAVGLIPVEIDRDAAFRLAVSQHMEILNAIDRFEDSKRKVRIAADQLRPELGLFANASLSSEAPYDYTNFDFDELRYQAGVTLNLPVDRLRERNNYRAALVSFESQLRSLALTLDNFKERIDRGLRTLEQQRLNYLNRRASLEVAQRRVEANELRLKAGRAEQRDVREAQDALISAQNALAATMADYLQARLQLLLDIGVLDTASSRFWLRDQLEGQLAAEMRGPPPLQMPDDTVLPPDRFLEPVEPVQ